MTDWISSSVPDKRGVSGQKPDKVGHLTRQKLINGKLEKVRLASIDPSKLLVGTLPLKSTVYLEHCFLHIRFCGTSRGVSGGGGGILSKIPSVVGVWIFSEDTPLKLSI